MADSSASTNWLVGRDRELEMLAGFLGETVSGGSSRLLTGEPGVGKTALMDAALAMALTRGARVIQGSGVEYESDVSFAATPCQLDDSANAPWTRMMVVCMIAPSRAGGCECPDRCSQMIPGLSSLLAPTTSVR